MVSDRLSQRFAEIFSGRNGLKMRDGVDDLITGFHMVPYVATTEDITVTVRPVYLDSQSDMINRRFVFGYFIRILNNSADEVQLLRRHWLIRDSEGRLQEVEGEGVVGEQPIIAPGGDHKYNSFCVLQTFEGSMEGTYLMQRSNGERFRIAIPRFDLRAAAN